MIIEFQSIALIVIILLLALTIINLIDKKKHFKPETKRKMFHITMGLTMLIFPYIFNSVYSVGCLAFIALAFLLTLKNTKLKDTLGSTLYSVERKSFGEIFFVISVFLVFYLSKGDKILYSIPILILTFADSAAALTGKNYGKKKISRLNEDAKSLEGSFMFFIVAFLLVLVPLLLYTQVGREELLIISTIVGLNVALIEMISHSGNDNLLIPLTTFAFLVTLMDKDVYLLRQNILIIICIYVLVTIFNNIKTWSKLALAEIMVVGYLTIILYGFYAIFPPLMLFLTVMLFPSKRPTEKKNVYDARIIETNIAIGITLCAFVAITNLRKELFMLYSLNYAMHLCVNTFVRFKYYLKYAEYKCLILGFMKGFVFILLPSALIKYLMFKEITPIDWLSVYTAALYGSGVLIMFERKHFEKEKISIENGYTHLQIVGLFTGLVGLLEYINIMGITLL